MSRLSSPAWLICVSTVAYPSLSVAADGILEINQTCALAGLPGDAAGFPVAITHPGSDALTRHLDARGLPNPEEVAGILVDVDGVSVGLRGFAILGLAGGATPPGGPGARRA